MSEEQQQYERICRPEFAVINEKLNTIHNRLFIDNGSPSVQTRLDRNERMLKVALWIITVIAAAIITQAVKDFSNHLQDERAQEVDAVIST